MGFLFEFIRVLCHVFTVAIIFQAILSWVSPQPANMLVVILFRVTEPILAPLRRLLPSFGTLDFSPMVAIILLQLIANLLP